MAEPVNRAQLTDDDIKRAIFKLQKEVAYELNNKGPGAFVSRNEILGSVVRELWELEQSLDMTSLDTFSDELADIAVVCIIGLAGIEAGKTGC